MKSWYDKRMKQVVLDNKRILVTFLMHLGDLVLVTPFIHALRKVAPSAYIVFLCDEKLKDVVLHNPYIDEIVTIDRYGRDNHLLSLWACAQKLSKMSFDVLINLHPNERCSFIAAFTKTKMRVGTSHFLFRWFWDVFTPLDRKKHAADMYLDVLTQLGAENIDNEGLEIFSNKEIEQNVKEFWQENNISADDKLIGFNIGSAVVTKRWASERFAAVADFFAEKGYKIVFFGGNMDKFLVEEAVQKMQKQAIVATGKLTIGELAVAMRRCSVIITNDSGPMHVAISQKVPIVALYGPSHTELYGPYRANATVVTALPKCEGCKDGMKHQCDDMRCMNDLTVEQVIQAAKEKLGVA